MPSERIYPARNDSHSDQPMHVHLQWGRDHGDVNLGVVHDSPDAEAKALYLFLDRAALNALIHKLRRARDQACGKDA